MPICNSLLLKHYTTLEECTDCTVYGEGPKWRGLKKDTLFKIKRGYELMYSVTRLMERCNKCDEQPFMEVLFKQTQTVQCIIMLDCIQLIEICFIAGASCIKPV